MARFVFELESVLRQRERDEQTERVRVAVIDTERAEAERQLRATQQFIETSRDELRERLAGNVVMTGVRTQASASLSRLADAQACAVRLAGILTRLGEARGRLVEASARRRAIELLRERRHEQWLEKLRKKEAAELDEIGVMRHRRAVETGEQQ